MHSTMHKKPIAAAVAVAAIGGLTYAAIPGSGSAAPERASAHVKRVVLHEIRAHQLGARSFAGVDRIRSRESGKIVGFDSFTGTFNPRTDRSRIWVGIALRGGTMQGRVSQRDESSRFRGLILNGTGTYRGARGSITGHSVDDSNRTVVTLRYTL